MHPSAAVLVASFVACSGAMLLAVRLAHRVAKSNGVVTIVGPTGSGKSALARLIHVASGRSGSLAEVSAGELTSTLAQDQLFGHERGAYTGALTRRHGVFAEANGGTVLLDDFHLLDRALQPILLRVLDSGQYRPLGSDREVPVSARLLVGSGEDLDRLVAQDRLLPDLRYRLGFQMIQLQALADRREDIGLLAERFLTECASADACADQVRFAPDVLPVLEVAPWPGNVRELRAAIQFAYAAAVGVGERTIRGEHLPSHLQLDLTFDAQSDHATKKQLVSWALWRSGDHVGRAAQLIKAHRNTVATLRLELTGERGRVPMHNAGTAVVQSDLAKATAS